MGSPPDVAVYGGSLKLKVVGTSFRQDELCQVIGGRPTGHINIEVLAVLEAESNNEHDDNAIAVSIDGLRVGHLSREDAVMYRPGLEALVKREGKSIGLHGRIIGGVEGKGGSGFLGVRISLNSEDFGLPALPPDSSMPAAVHTGPTETLPIKKGDTWLRDFYCEIKRRLSPTKDKVSLLESCQQMAIERHEAMKWLDAIEWAEEGLNLYVESDEQPEATRDLENIIADCRARLAVEDKTREQTIPSPREIGGSEIETLRCANCGTQFDRPVLRGRKPAYCPSCR